MNKMAIHRCGSGARLGLLGVVAALVLALIGVATWPAHAEDAGATSESAALILDASSSMTQNDAGRLTRTDDAKKQRTT